jgi:hypothetical protein
LTSLPSKSAQNTHGHKTNNKTNRRSRTQLSRMFFLLFCLRRGRQEMAAVRGHMPQQPPGVAAGLV